LSNYPFRYKLSWLPRFVTPALGPATPGVQSETLLTGVEKTARLVFVGDISAVANRRTPAVDDALRTLFASANLIIGNCESPVVERPRYGGSRFGAKHAMSSTFLSNLLDAASIDPKKTVLSLANNHILDQGVEGFDETLSALDRLGIRTIGAVRDGWPSVHEARSLRIAFLAFTQWRNASREAFEGRVMTLDDVTKRGRLIPDADLLCAVPHWDWEFRQQPRPETQALGRRLVEGGVGLIAGHHAHVVQPMERIGEAVVAYGLGDFVGTAWPFVRRPLRTGAVFVADVSLDPATRGKIARYELIMFDRQREGDRERLTIRP